MWTENDYQDYDQFLIGLREIGLIVGSPKEKICFAVVGAFKILKILNQETILGPYHEIWQEAIK